MSAYSRLSTVAPDLVELGESLSAGQRKAIAFRAAEWACRTTGAMTLLGEDCLRLLSDTTRSATHEERQKIAGDVDDLDERYFALIEEHDGLDNSGEAMRWFTKARAAASLLYSLDGSAMQGFCESLYEAQAATGDLDGLRTLCRDVS